MMNIFFCMSVKQHKSLQGEIPKLTVQITTPLLRDNQNPQFDVHFYSDVSIIYSHILEQTDIFFCLFD